MPGFGDPFERVNAAILERNAGADDQILDGCRREHFTRFRKSADAGADVHGDSRQIAPAHLAFPAVQTTTNLDAEATRFLGDRPCAAHGPPRSVEGGEEPVAEGLYLATLEPLNRTSSGLVVTIEQVAPRVIAEGCGSLGRAYDVGEQDGG